MSESKGATRAVDRMIDAIRAEPPPAVDWTAMERSLLARIRRGEGATKRSRSTSPMLQALAFAAAAALVPIGLSAGGATPGSSHSAASAQANSETTRLIDASRIGSAPGRPASEHSLSVLQRGDAIESASDVVTFADASKIRWTLDPESRVVVQAPAHESGIGHVLRLDRGKIRIEVEPDLVTQGLVDVLAVEVGQTRVAVHGTVFTVSLRDGEAHVEVERGVVTVGPKSQRGATTGYQLPAGSRAAISLDGAQRARWLPRQDTSPALASRTPLTNATSHEVKPRVSAPPISPKSDDDVPQMVDPPPSPVAKAPTAQTAPAPAPETTAATEPKEPEKDVTAEPPKPTMSVASVQAGLLRCFRQAHPRSSIHGPKLTASSTFTLTLRADGSVQGARFNPPLPSIQGCAAFVFGGTFAPSASGTTISIPVQLSQ